LLCEVLMVLCVCCSNISGCFTAVYCDLACVVATYQGVSPQFIVWPADQVVVEGATVVMFCAANGRDSDGGKPNVIWLKDGAALDLK